MLYVVLYFLSYSLAAVIAGLAGLLLWSSLGRTKREGFEVFVVGAFVLLFIAAIRSGTDQQVYAATTGLVLASALVVIIRFALTGSDTHSK